MSVNKTVYYSRFNFAQVLFLLIGTVFIDISRAQSCFDYYSKNAHMGPSASRVNMILNLDRNEVDQAKAKLTVEDQKAMEQVQKRVDAIKIEVEKLEIPQEKAEEWLKRLIKEKFLFGVLHEGIWLRAIHRVSNSSNSSNYFSVIHSDSQALDIANKVYLENSAKDKDLRNVFYWEQMEFYLNTLDLTNWNTLDSSQQSKIYSKYIDLIRDYAVGKNLFIGQMNILSEIYQSKGGPSFIGFLVKNSAPELAIQSRKRHNPLLGRAGISTAAAAAVAASIPYFANESLLSASMMAVFGGIVSPLITFAGGGIILDGINYKGRFKAILERRNGRRNMEALIGRNSLDRKSEAVQEAIVSLEKAEDSDDFTFGQIKAELDRGLQGQFILVPTWGKEFTSGLLSLNKRIKGLKSRYKLVVNDTESIMKNLESMPAAELKELTAAQLESYHIINSISKEDMINLFIDYQSIKSDFLALAIALDKYTEKLNEMLANGHLNQAHIAVINTQKLMFAQHLVLLESLTHRLHTDSQEIAEAMGIINQVSMAIQVDLMQKTMNP